MGSIPDERDVAGLLRAMPKAERNTLLAYIESGRPVPDREQAPLAVAVARRHVRRGYRHLPVHIGVALAFGIGGYLIVGTSAGFAAPFFGALVAFVGFFWWGDTMRARRRAVVANLALLEGDELPTPKPSRASGYLTIFTVAWAFTLFVNAILYVLGAPGWLGPLVFVASLIVFRRLLRANEREVEKWQDLRRST